MSMKGRFKILAAVFALPFFCAAGAAATSYSFGDETIYWPGWSNGRPAAYGLPMDDTNDHIGVPNFLGGTAEVIGGKLTRLTFAVQNPQEYWNGKAIVSPGDLFISTLSGATPAWNHVVDLTTASTWTTPGYGNTVVPGGSYQLYNVNIPLGNTASYILSGTDLKPDWSSFLIRDNHPVAAATAALTSAAGPVSFSGWPTATTSPILVSFDFTALPDGGLVLSSGDLTLGWTANCANDVVYEHIYVPEPGTLLLVGFGLLGVALQRRRFQGVKSEA